jgi:hypothetical protein
MRVPGLGRPFRDKSGGFWPLMLKKLGFQLGISVVYEAIDAAAKAARLSQNMRRERREAKVERKAIDAAAAPEQQTEKAAAPMRQDKNDNAVRRLSLDDLRPKRSTPIRLPSRIDISWRVVQLAWSTTAVLRGL